uniref:Uncharacterized protein n=1 Tax=Ciona savignyi TaxID=51511 RepID=H2ZNQ0_CIOSA
MVIDNRPRSREHHGYGPYNRAKPSHPAKNLPHRRPNAPRGSSYAHVAESAAPTCGYVGTQPMPGSTRFQNLRTNFVPKRAPTPAFQQDQNRVCFSRQDVALAALPMTLPPPIDGSTKLPKFGFLYQEFERMKKRGFMKTPPPPPDQTVPTYRNPNPHPHPIPTFNLTTPAEPANERDCFVAAMKLFMKSYMPTACFDCAQPVDDWSKEAGALMDEIANATSEERHIKSSWPTISRRTSIDSSVDSNRISMVEDIHRHLLEIQPSPYPSGLPASVHSSDNEDDETSSLDKSPIQQPCSYSQTKDRVRLSMDSGYQSSSTDSSSVVGGYPTHAR